MPIGVGNAKFHLPPGERFAFQMSRRQGWPPSLPSARAVMKLVVGTAPNGDTGRSASPDAFAVWLCRGGCDDAGIG